MFDSSVIELSKSALGRNLRFLRKRLGEHVVISSVIKGNAYGHGLDPFVPLAESCGIRHFSVFDANEAYQVHQCMDQVRSHIMIMGYMDAEAVEWAIENDISFFIYDFSRLEIAMKYARRIGKPARVHLELETGMNRTGLREAEVARAIQLIRKKADCITIDGVCTHFAGAESIANYKRVIDQYARFNNLCAKIEEMEQNIPCRHTASSAAALSYPDTRMDMVRIGIAQYGFWPSKEVEMQFWLREHEEARKSYSDPLRRVLRWSSKIMHITPVDAGEFVGYGTSYLTLRPQRVATVPVGYSHGFRRSLSNLGRVLIRGKRANVIGLVNMSMMLVDVTSIPSAAVGDEVVIIGKQGNGRITVSSFSDMANLVNYEMLVRLPADIPRVVVD